MVSLLHEGAYLLKGKLILQDADKISPEEINARLISEGLEPLADIDISQEKARSGTIAYQILTEHNQSDNWRNMNIRFDALASHDLTYVGIVQTAALGGLKEFPVPFVMTNCHIHQGNDGWLRQEDTYGGQSYPLRSIRNNGDR